MSNALLNPSLTVTLYGDAVKFLPAAQFNKRNESWREEWWWGGGGQYSFQADDQKGVQALWGQLYPNYSEEDTPDF